MDAARRSVVLADHTMIDVDSRFKIAGVDKVDVLVTDPGILPPQRLGFVNRGIKLELAGQDMEAVPRSFALQPDN